uniref:Integrase catalytic domain-containing protein n=1 Tax=Strigamia maritima TaxID=126957 RepID=T1IUX3_STRMM
MCRTRKTEVRPVAEYSNDDNGDGFYLGSVRAKTFGSAHQRDHWKGEEHFKNNGFFWENIQYRGFDLDEEISTFVHGVTSQLAVSDERLAEIITKQQEGDECGQLIKYCQEGWPTKDREFPKYPWQKVGLDLFKLDSNWYLLVTDYYSRFPFVFTLKSLHEKTIITHLDSLFSVHGTPEIVFSDN